MQTAFKTVTLLKLPTTTNPQQGKQREPSAKTLRSLLSTEFWRHYMLSGGTQRRNLSRLQSEEMEI